MTTGLVPRAEDESERLVVQTSLVRWSSGIIHRALPFRWPPRSRPLFELFPVLLRGIGAATCRFGEFWMTNGLLPRAESERLVVQTSLLCWSSGITHRALPSCPPLHSLPSFELFLVLLRGVAAASCRPGGFWVSTGFSPPAEGESERVVVQTSSTHWSFFCHSAHDPSGIIHRALPSC